MKEELYYTFINWDRIHFLYPLISIVKILVLIRWNIVLEGKQNLCQKKIKHEADDFFQIARQKRRCHKETILRFNILSILFGNRDPISKLRHIWLE